MIGEWAPKIIDGFEYGSTCMRPNKFFTFIDNYPQSEDCLFLNIFVPGACFHYLSFPTNENVSKNKIV